MIVPNKIILYSIFILPLSVVALLVPSIYPIWLGAVVLLAILALADAIFAVRSSSAISVHCDSNQTMFLGRECKLPVTFNIMQSRPCNISTKLLTPSSLGCKENELQLTLSNEQSIVSWLCTAEQRGDHTISELFIQVRSLLGMWSYRRKLELECCVKVYPDLFAERKKLARFFAQGSTGAHLQRSLGQGREFEKLRDYVAGDSFANICWKASAKRGEPVTKEFQIETTQEIYVVVDTSRSSGKLIEETTALENYLLAALMLGQVAENQGDLFGVMAYDEKVRSFIRAKSGKSHYTACREAVYALHPQKNTQDFGALFTFIKSRLRRRSLVIFLTDLSDSTVAEAFCDNINMISAQHLCMVNMIKSDTVAPLFENGTVTNSNDIYSHLAGHMNWSNLINVQKNLSRHGVGFNMVNAGDLSGQMINSYLDIKKRQLI